MPTTELPNFPITNRNTCSDRLPLFGSVMITKLSSYLHSSPIVIHSSTACRQTKKRDKPAAFAAAAI